MKKLFVLFSALLLGTLVFATNPPEVDQKLVQSFKTNFPHATEVNWYEEENAYVVNFLENGIRSRISYQKDGKITEISRSYKEANMPFYVQYVVKRKYPGKSIFGVIEMLTVSEPGTQSQIEYHVKLEDDTTWTTVKLDSDGHLSIVEKFRKSFAK